MTGNVVNNIQVISETERANDIPFQNEMIKRFNEHLENKKCQIVISDSNC